MTIDLNDDVLLANNMRNRAYVKYTPYTVGAVLTTRNGKKYTGCNIQNNGIQSYCAERVAFLKAISEGEFLFDRIVIMGGPEGKPAEKCLPCGYCRQFMSEFVGKDFKVYTVYDNKVEEYKFEELLPYAFNLNEK